MQKSTFFSPGILFAISGVIFFSAKAVVIKMAYQYNVTSEHFLLFRMVFSLPFYLIIAAIYRPSKPNVITKTDYIWLLFFGFIGYYLAAYLDFLGLQYIKAGLERIILFVYPTLVLIISRIFLKKVITKEQSLAICITYIGVLVTFWGELQWDVPNLFLGGILIFFSALAYAIYLVGSGWLLPKFGVLSFTSYAMIVSTICVCAQYLIFDGGNIFEYPSEVYMLGGITAVFCTIIPSFLVSAAIDKLGASDFSIIASLGPVSTIVLAYYILDEHLNYVQIVGALIVMVGVYVVTKKKNA